jgi:hypothetical protein
MQVALSDPNGSPADRFARSALSASRHGGLRASRTKPPLRSLSRGLDVRADSAKRGKPTSLEAWRVSGLGGFVPVALPSAAGTSRNQKWSGRPGGRGKDRDSIALKTLS